MAKRKTSAAKHVQMGLIETPFFGRMNALSRAKSWTGWAGYISPLVLDTVEFEYFAIRNQATLFDISPMHKYRISGPDALAMLNRLVTRDVAKIGNGRVGYVMWCDEEGMLIDDGTLFRFSETDFRLCCQEPMFTWLLDAAWGYDAQVVDESDAIAALSLQGPTSWSVLNDAGFSNIETMKPFDWREVAPDIWVSRTGFTGDLGYEIWVPWSKAAALWDRLWDAGDHWGLRAIGFEALNMCRIEAGFVAAGVDFQPVHAVMRLHRGRTPIELGFAKMVHFDKGHFNGRRALLRQRDFGGRYALVKIDIAGFKPANGALIYHKKKKEIGFVTSGVWSPTMKSNIALAELKAPYGSEVVDDIWAEIYVNEEGKWDKRLVPVTIKDAPFFANARARATPPRPY